MKAKNGNTLIESLGTYLPPKSVSTKEIVAGCVNEVRFPIERITGIKERRMAGEEEFAIDMATNAVRNCLSHSKYNPQAIDLVVCCNISHYDAPEQYIFESSAASHLKKEFGFDNATTLDISNACAGIFTGIVIGDAYLKAGMARRVMVVSGEYITHLTKTAQKEIQDLYDLRLACLTLGDSGVALILERTDRTDIGFQSLELFTLGNYSHFCIAKKTDFPHGGAIMYTHSAELSGVAVQEGAKHTAKFCHDFGSDSVDWLISHQTSSTSILSGIREVNKNLNFKKFDIGNTINNLEKRGNTSTTSHIVAVMDNIHTGKITSGQNILFSINASGVTLGSAVYTFDDLPDRILQNEAEGKSTTKTDIHDEMPDITANARVKIKSIGLLPTDSDVKKSIFDMSRIASQEAFEQANMTGDDLDMLLFTGNYRDEYISEPAIAALLAGDIKMRSEAYAQDGKNSFAFDVVNGAGGFLNAVQIAATMTNSNKAHTFMVINSEIEPNKALWNDYLMGLEETASSVILQRSDDQTGFSDFIFRTFTDHQGDYSTYNIWVDGVPLTKVHQTDNLEDVFVDCIHQTILESNLDLDKIAKIFPQQISTTFIEKLSKALNQPLEKFVNVTEGKNDLYTSSIPFAMGEVLKNGTVKSGDVGLLISVGGGVQVGVAQYHF